MTVRRLDSGAGRRLVGLAQLSRSWGTTLAHARRACRTAGITVVRAPTPDGAVAPHVDAHDVDRLRRELEATGAVPVGRRRTPLPPPVDLRHLPTIPVDTCWGPDLG